MKVLLVEDHPALAQISCDLLREVYGHQVEHAPNGRTALELAPRLAPDVILIDLNLPDMCGYELAKQLRERPELAETVMVALTALGQSVTPEAAAAAGLDGHFRKPMNFEVLPKLTRAAS